MNKNIYIQSMELGYNNSVNGISFDELTDKLQIDFIDETFKVNYTIWFYSNFYNESAEHILIGSSVSSLRSDRVSNKISGFLDINSRISFIKGDTINKYIDYLELERTRKSAIKAEKNSKKAFRFSIISIIIAIVSIVTSTMLTYYSPPMKYIIIPDERNKTQKHIENDTLNGEFANEKKMSKSESDTTSKLEHENCKTDTIK